MEKQGGVIARLPAKGSMFITVKWFWQCSLGHVVSTDTDRILDVLSKKNQRGTESGFYWWLGFEAIWLYK